MKEISKFQINGEDVVLNGVDISIPENEQSEQPASCKSVNEVIEGIDVIINGTNISHRYWADANTVRVIDVIPSGIIEPGMTIKCKLTTETAGITSYGLCTINGYFFGGYGIVDFDLDTEYTVKVSQTMYNYMVDAGDSRLQLFIPASMITGSGHFNFDLMYDWDTSVQGKLNAHDVSIAQNTSNISALTPSVNRLSLELKSVPIEIAGNSGISWEFSIKKGDLICIKNTNSDNSHEFECRYMKIDGSLLYFVTLQGGTEYSVIAEDDYKGLRFDANKDNTVLISVVPFETSINKSVTGRLLNTEGQLQSLLLPNEVLSFSYEIAGGGSLPKQRFPIIKGVTYEVYYKGNNQWQVQTFDEYGTVESNAVTFNSHEYGYFTAKNNALYIGGYTSSTVDVECTIKVTDIIAPISSQYSSEYKALLAENKDIPVINSQPSDSVINISTQSDFDNVETLIKNAIAEGKTNIVVVCSNTTLTFNDKHFNFITENYQECDNVNVSIVGNQTTLIPKGSVLSADSAVAVVNGYYKIPYNKEYSFRDLLLDHNNKEIITSTPVQYADSQVETVDESSKYYRIKLANVDVNVQASAIKVFTHFTADYEYIDKIEDGYVYFYQQQIDTAINQDYAFPRTNYGPSRNIKPRYCLLNASTSDAYIQDNYLYLKSKYHSVLYCESSNLVEINNCFKSILIQGFNCIGNAGSSGYYFHSEKQTKGLINIESFKGEFIKINDNTFTLLKDNAVRVNDNKVSNILIYNNKLIDSYRGLVTGTTLSKNVFVYDNECLNNGRYSYYEGILNVAGTNFLLLNNTIIDFAYSAIRTGSEYPDGEEIPEGIIDGNYIKLSNDYIARSYNYCLMDQGAIYIYCKIEKLIIKNNIIIGSCGQYQNNGIMIDGHASNCKILNNIILGSCGNGINHSILSYKDINAPSKSLNNFIMNNIIDNKITFTGFENCIKGPNIILKNDKTQQDLSLIDVPITEEDYLIFNVKKEGDFVMIPSRYEFAFYKFLQLNPKVASHIKLSGVN